MGITGEIRLREEVGVRVSVVIHMTAMHLHIPLSAIGEGTEHHVGEGGTVMEDVVGSHFVFPFVFFLGESLTQGSDISKSGMRTNRTR